MPTTSPPSVTAAKQALRGRLRALRTATAGTTSATPTALAAQLLTTLGPTTVFCYLASAGEAPTATLFDELLALGCTVLVPAIVARTTMQATRFPGWSALVPGHFGIPGPTTAEPFGGRIDCVLVPGLAFSTAGVRLGFGAGYYDRWLAGHPAALRIGLCFEYQVLPQIPCEVHDASLDYLVSERRIVACPTRNRHEKSVLSF